MVEQCERALIWMGLCYYLGLNLCEWGNSVGRALVWLGPDWRDTGQAMVGRPVMPSGWARAAGPLPLALLLCLCNPRPRPAYLASGKTPWPIEAGPTFSPVSGHKTLSCPEQFLLPSQNDVPLGSPVESCFQSGRIDPERGCGHLC